MPVLRPATLLLLLASLPAGAASAQGESGAGLLVGFEPTGSSTTLRVIIPGPFASVPIVSFPAKLSAVSRHPTFPVLSCTGGWDDGGNLYHLLSNGHLFLAGPTGYGAIPALAWDPNGATLWGVSGGFFGAALVMLDPSTGAATAVGATGVFGIEALAARPGTGTLYGTTGYHYDGSPGDVFTFDKSTGLATDTGFDLKDASGAGPACTVSGLSFSLDGSTGYASIGCGNWGAGAGTLLSFDPTTFVTTELGQATGGGSLSAVEVVF